MLIVAVIVHNRFQNIVKWIKCWKNSDTQYWAKLVIIHNDDGNWKLYRDLCAQHAIPYVLRQNIGYDIGAMQDVFRERLHGFPNGWDYLLWCTDDVMPMAKEFAHPFVEKFDKGVGITAMHISTEYKPHVRTGCFMIRKPLSLMINFPDDPVTTKLQCYQFEHRSDKTLTDQVRLFGYSCLQVATLRKAPMYDTEYWKRNRKSVSMFHILNRDKEYRSVWM